MKHRGQRVTVMGLGQFGGGAGARWLAAQGAIVTVTDLADETTLAAALQSLATAPIAAFHLGGHREEDFRQANLVVVNPAVRPANPWLAIARENGVRLTTEIDLYLLCAFHLPKGMNVPSIAAHIIRRNSKFCKPL